MFKWILIYYIIVMQFQIGFRLNHTLYTWLLTTGLSKKVVYQQSLKSVCDVHKKLETLGKTSAKVGKTSENSPRNIRTTSRIYYRSHDNYCIQPITTHCGFLKYSLHFCLNQILFFLILFALLVNCFCKFFFGRFHLFIKIK